MKVEIADLAIHDSPNFIFVLLQLSREKTIKDLPELRHNS